MLTILLALAIAPSKEVRYHCDLIEHNTTYSRNVIEGGGKHGENLIRIVKQASYWNFWKLHEDGRYHVMDYRVVQSGDMLLAKQGAPHLILDGRGGRYRIVGKVYYESHCFSEDDPEVVDRTRFPKVERVQLPGVRWVPLTHPLSSSTFGRSHEWSRLWPVDTIKDAPLNMRFVTHCWNEDSLASDRLGARAASISSLGTEPWSSRSSASETDRYHVKSGLGSGMTPWTSWHSRY